MTAYTDEIDRLLKRIYSYAKYGPYPPKNCTDPDAMVTGDYQCFFIEEPEANMLLCHTKGICNKEFQYENFCRRFKGHSGECE